MTAETKTRAELWWENSIFYSSSILNSGWYYINCEMYILSPCPVHPIPNEERLFVKTWSVWRKTPLPVVKKINVEVNYRSKVWKPLIAAYLLQIIIIIKCLQSCLPPPSPNSALLRCLSDTHRHKNNLKIKTKPGTYLISRMLLGLTSLFKVRHFWGVGST